jgi:intergrase/recombinase
MQDIIKNHTKPGNSQSRRLKTASSIIKTITVATRKNQGNLSSHIRRLRISQVRHLKTGSLIFCPGERISQSRHLTILQNLVCTIISLSLF